MEPNHHTHVEVKPDSWTEKKWKQPEYLSAGKLVWNLPRRRPAFFKEENPMRRWLAVVSVLGLGIWASQPACAQTPAYNLDRFYYYPYYYFPHNYWPTM